MRSRYSLFGILGASVLSMMIAAPPVTPPRPVETVQEAVPTKRRRRLASAQAPQRFRRGRRPQAKPRSKPNRVTIGRRVRRKHRRAA